MVNHCEPTPAKNGFRSRPVSTTALRLLRLMVRLFRGQVLTLPTLLDEGLTPSPGQLIKDLHALRLLGLPLSRPANLSVDGYKLDHGWPPIQWQPHALSWLQSLSGQIQRGRHGDAWQALRTVAPWLVWRSDPSQAPAGLIELTKPSTAVAENELPLPLTETLSPSGLSPEACEWLCQQRQQLQLLIAQPTTSPTLCDKRVIEPHRLLNDGTVAALLGYSPEDSSSVLVPLSSILRVVQLPGLNRQDVALQRVIFCLTGRLAKSYRLYPGEQVQGGSLGIDDALTVEAWVPHVEKLLDRLMRYGPHCQVLRPTSARQRMRQRIATQLALLPPHAGDT